MSTRFERILKLFLSPLLSTFKLYNTQPNPQQKSAMVWQGFMLQVRLQRFFCKSKRKFNFCPPFLCKNVKNWNCICKWDFFKSQIQFVLLAAIVLLLFCCWDFLLIKWWPEKNYIQIFLASAVPAMNGYKNILSERYYQNTYMKLVMYTSKICIKYRKHWKSCMGFQLPGQTRPFLAVLKKTLGADYEQLLRAVFSCFQGQKTS